jgi:hypothetical protein
MLMYNYMEMARVTGVPVGWLLVRGQMLKVFAPSFYYPLSDHWVYIGTINEVKCYSNCQIRDTHSNKSNNDVNSQVMSQLLRKTRDRGLVLPAVRVESLEDKFEVYIPCPLRFFWR